MLALRVGCSVLALFNDGVACYLLNCGDENCWRRVLVIRYWRCEMLALRVGCYILALLNVGIVWWLLRCGVVRCWRCVLIVELWRC